jgi:hypothetical protein
VKPEEWQRRHELEGLEYLEDAYNAKTDLERDELWAKFHKEVRRRAHPELFEEGRRSWPHDARDSKIIVIAQARKYWRELGGADEDFREP